ncbi:hypothetical protein [Alishewanella longhuensis]
MTKQSHSLALNPLQLCPQLDSKLITQALQKQEQPPAFIGQDRARTALEFAIGMDMPGYNLYVMG